MVKHLRSYWFYKQMYQIKFAKFSEQNVIFIAGIS